MLNKSKKQEARSKKQEARSKKQEARSKKQEAGSRKHDCRQSLNLCSLLSALILSLDSKSWPLTLYSLILCLSLPQTL